MGRCVRGRALLLLVLFLGIATLVALPPALAQARVVPPPVLFTPAPVGPALASPCMRRPLMQCRRVRRLVVSEGALSSRGWVWECRAVARLRLDRPPMAGCFRTDGRCAVRCVSHDPLLRDVAEP